MMQRENYIPVDQITLDFNNKGELEIKGAASTARSGMFFTNVSTEDDIEGNFKVYAWDYAMFP